MSRVRPSIIAAVAVVAALGCKRDAPPPPPVAAPAPVARVVRVSAVDGKVMREHAGGAATLLHAGDVLGADDVVRTDDGSSATLDVAGVADVQVATRTQVSIGELTRRLSGRAWPGGRPSPVAGWSASGPWAWAPAGGPRPAREAAASDR